MDDVKESGIRLGFEIKGYPGTGRRSEHEVDLSTCNRIDLVLTAFMGDATMIVGDVDFTTEFGWVTLLGWLLKVRAASRTLEAADTYTLTFAESDDSLSFRRYKDLIFVAASFRQGIGMVEFEPFKLAVREYVDTWLEWISMNYPAAYANPRMPRVLEMLGP